MHIGSRHISSLSQGGGGAEEGGGTVGGGGPRREDGCRGYMGDRRGERGEGRGGKEGAQTQDRETDRQVRLKWKSERKKREGRWKFLSFYWFNNQKCVHIHSWKNKKAIVPNPRILKVGRF